MAKIALTNMQGANVGEIELSDGIFAVPMNEPVVHQVIVAQLANKRQGTQSALGRTEVSGGGKKPWRQKGTGRARQGSTRAPQWTHGGVVFAPKPRDYSKSVPRKVKRLAMKCALSAKVAGNEMIVLDALSVETPKTREMAKILNNIGATGKTLLVLPGKDETIARVSNNISGLKLAFVNTINVLDIMNCDKFVVVKEAVSKIEEVYA
ncbi:MAG: 50S ribosomal protein L4 [Candidatus Spyradocola sp.]|nr:50S ribosomal protein L4 [Candidatus Spyradocola sp.]